MIAFAIRSRHTQNAKSATLLGCRRLTHAKVATRTVGNTVEEIQGVAELIELQNSALGVLGTGDGKAGLISKQP
jgi:hypothetical protein